MRAHDHDFDGGRNLRWTDLNNPGLTYRAAVAGRIDVPGPAGLLGYSARSITRLPGGTPPDSSRQKERAGVDWYLIDEFGSQSR